MRPSAARNRRPSNDRLIHLELFTDFFNEIGQKATFDKAFGWLNHSSDDLGSR